MSEGTEKPPPNNPETRSTPIIGGLIYLKDKFTRKQADTLASQPESTQAGEPAAMREENFTPPSQPQISRQERRQMTKDTYSSQRAGQTPTAAVSEQQTATPSIASEPKSTRNPNLPKAFESIKQEAGMTFNPTPENMPWVDLNRDTNPEVHLATITLAGSGEQFYYGSFIRGKILVQAAGQLDSHRKQLADNLLYTHIPDIVINNYSPFAKFLDDANSDEKILYFSNLGKFGLRVYFMRFQLNNNPVIIRVAVCDKSNQADVLATLTTRPHKWNKYAGRL